MIEIVGVLVGVTLIVGVGEAETLGTVITFDAAGPPTLQYCFTLKYIVPESPPTLVVLGEIQLPASVPQVIPSPEYSNITVPHVASDVKLYDHILPET